MSDQVNNNLAENSLQDKIEKLMELINECATSQNRQQLDKCEKLQQKLRYLQYYQSYDLGPCPEYVNTMSLHISVMSCSL